MNMKNWCRVDGWFAYRTSPLDEDWECFEAASIEAVPKEARSAASELGWEGDVRGDDCAEFFVPTADGTVIRGFVWKQDNNGDTFVVASGALTHLEER
jgi:hypothetical protein